MNQEEGKAVNALKDIALESLKEQRRARRWGIFFKLFFLAYLLFIGLMAFAPWSDKSKLSTGKQITAVVDVNGIIASDTEAGANWVIPSLRKAFEHKQTKGVIIRINSPGGSPVQSGYINDEIKRLKEKYPDIPVYAVVADVCASGGYYIGVAADKIYADKASIVGSIGVRMDSFGLVDAMQKIGVERRLYTAGSNKGILDPFLPEDQSQSEHVQNMLDKTHQQFIKVVKEGRGDRLKDDPAIFSGLFWTGESAVELGLIDGLGSASYVARELIGAEEMFSFTTEKDFLQRLSDQVSAKMHAWFKQELSTTPQFTLQ